MKVTVLGAGAFGSVLGKIMEENGNEVKYFDPYKFPKVTLEEAVLESEMIVYAAPTAVAGEILPKLPKKVPIICASKGFLSLKPFRELEDFSALAGAGVAEEITEDNPPYGDKFILTASSEMAEFLFTTEMIQIEYTKDTLGILLSGALKNVYAIACGLGLDDYYQIQAEWREILEQNGATDLTRFSCGLPDLLMSVAYGSRNTEYGRTLAEVPKGTKVEPAGTVEGVTVINNLKDYPEFKLPETATIFKETVRRVQNATKL